MNANLLSHPAIYLSDHISQVKLAMEAILKHHQSSIRMGPFISSEICERLAQLHDLGKGSRVFQNYIKNPNGYRGDRLAKAHTPLSLILTIALARKEKWDSLTALALAQASNGHHGGIATREVLDQRLYSDGIATALKQQLSDLNMEELRNATGLKLDKLLLGKSPWLQAADYIDECWEEVDALSIKEAINYRLGVQWLFSLLLEADKAFLAVSDPELYLNYKPSYFPTSLVDKFIVNQPDTPINRLRQEARLQALSSLSKEWECGISTITLPTGIGKTLTGASWALTLRERLIKNGLSPKILVVLPFLSIIDQTEQVYRELLGVENAGGEIILPYHSLAERSYDSELEGSSEEFFIDTWRSEIIITTFDQFLMALMDGRARYQMRFHNLCDSLIIMDEVQTLPCKLWDPLNNIFKSLVERGNSRILAMSATLPAFLSDATELIENYKDYFRQFGRYRLILKHHQAQSLEAFCRSIGQSLSHWIDQGLRVLITLNTRSSAREVRDFLEQEGAEPLFFLSGDVTPRDRLRAIQVIKENKPCIVVSTQCVEAGVDIDLDLVIRDFAPLDSIIQIAGRCNRNCKKPRCDVEVVSLANSNGRLFCEIIGYDPIHLQETRIALSASKEINEENIVDFCSRYFAALAMKKDIGAEITESFARWTEMPSVRELLRGKEHEQHHFLVIEQDPHLKEDLESMIRISDRWERRRILKKLAGRIAQIEVSVYAKPGFDPEDIANRSGNLWLLREGFYSSQRGLELKPNLSVETLIV